MKKRRIWEIVIGTIGILLLVFGIIILAHKSQSNSTIREELDMNCLRQYAEYYCEYEAIENKRLDVYRVNDETFSCIIKLDERTRYIEIRTYYFLDEEISDCKYLIEVERSKD